MNRFKFLIFFIIFLGLNGCEDEGDLDITTEEIGKKKFQRISLESFASKVGNIPKYDQLSILFDINNTISQQRLDINNEATLITDEIVMIEEDDVTYYTFKIDTNIIENEFYNLVVSIDNSGDILGMRILEYTPSENWLDDTTQTFSGTIKLIENEFFVDSDIMTALNARVSNTCVVSYDWEWNCNANNPHAPNTCEAGGSDIIIIPVYGPCPAGIDAGDSPGGGLPINPGNNSPGSGTNDGSNNDDSDDDSQDDDCIIVDSNGNCQSDATTPMPVITKADKKNCEELEEDLQDPEYPIPDSQKSIIQALTNLKNEATNALDPNAREKGFNLSTNSSNQKVASPINIGNSNKIKYNKYINIYGGLHLHPRNGKAFPMFSFYDILNLLEFHNNFNPSSPTKPSVFVHYLVTYQGVYAIKIDDVSVLQQLQPILDDLDDANEDGIDLAKDYDDSLENVYSRFQDSMENPNGSPGEYEKELLKFMNNFDGNGNGLGISLFRANSSLTNWEKLTLNNNVVEGAPCLN